MVYIILDEIVEGGLLGDGSIRSQDGKYFTFQIVGKDVELMKRNFSIKNFRKILDALNLDISYLLKVLNTTKLVMN